MGMVFFVAWMLIPEQVMPLWLNNLLLGVAVVGTRVNLIGGPPLPPLRHRSNRLPDRPVRLVVVPLGATYALGLAGLHLPARYRVIAGRRRHDLAVAALFNPLRKRVQGFVDHRFNRSRYDAERVMDEFTGALRDRVDGRPRR